MREKIIKLNYNNNNNDNNITNNDDDKTTKHMQKLLQHTVLDSRAYVWLRATSSETGSEMDWKKDRKIEVEKQWDSCCFRRLFFQLDIINDKSQKIECFTWTASQCGLSHL